jgi:hypothetical protein
MNFASRDVAEPEHHDGKDQDQSLVRQWAMKGEMKGMVELAELMYHRWQA